MAWIDHSVTDYDGNVGDPTHITRVEYGHVPVADVAHLKGRAGEQPGEHRTKHGQDWESFKQDIANNGVKNPIFITVDYGEEPKISEGNHRRDAAVELGMTHIPAEVRYFGHAEHAGGISRESALTKEATWKTVRDKAVRIRKDGGVRIIAANNGVIRGHVKGDTHTYETELTLIPGTKKTGAWFCGCEWGDWTWGRTGRYFGRPCSHSLALQFEAQARGMFGRQIKLDLVMPEWFDPSAEVHVTDTEQKRDLKQFQLEKNIKHAKGDWDRSSGEPVWKQPDHELLQDALIGWKGNTSDMRREVENEIKGADPQQGNGTQKIWRAQARALLNAAKNGKPNPKPLYRGNPSTTKPRTLEEWTEDHKVAEGWAKKYGGEVHVIKPGEGKGVKISDHVSSGLNEIEKGWVLHEPRPTTIYGANDFKVQRVSSTESERKVIHGDDQSWTTQPGKYMVPTHQVMSRQNQPLYRTNEQMEALRQDVNKNGIQRPITMQLASGWLPVDPTGGSSKAEYKQFVEFNDGHHRAAAAHQLGLSHIPVDLYAENDSDANQAARKHTNEASGFYNTKVASDGDIAPTAAMVALFLPRDIADKIAVPNGIKPEDMHVTLAYLGKDLTQQQKDSTLLIAKSVAEKYHPFTGVIGGLGQFPAGDNGTPYFATVDVPGLIEMRQDLIEALQAADLPVDMTHGYTPHITLTYAADDSEAPEPVGDFDVDFPRIGVSIGPEDTEFPFSQGRAAMKQAGIDTPVHELAGLIREYAERPLDDEPLHNEVDDISRAYRDMPILDPDSVAMWQALGALVNQQAQQLKNVYQVERLDDRDPYATAEEMHADIDRGIYKVTSLHSHHPVWDVDTNVAFRVVHDILGHGTAHSDFSYRGEVMAYRAECSVTPQELWPALFTEIVAQSAYVNVHHLFGEQKVGIIPLTQADIEAHVNEVMDAPDPEYDPLHVSASLDDPAVKMATEMFQGGTNPKAITSTLESIGVEDAEAISRIAFGGGSFKGKVKGVVQTLHIQNGQIIDARGNVVSGESIENPDFSPSAGLFVASKESAMDDNNTVDQDPEHALPVAYGDDEGQDLVAVLRQRLAKSATIKRTALKAFSPAEKQQLIDEGLGTAAGNLASLDLTGTHYRVVEELTPESDSNWLWGV